MSDQSFSFPDVDCGKRSAILERAFIAGQKIVGKAQKGFNRKSVDRFDPNILERMGFICESMNTGHQPDIRRAADILRILNKTSPNKIAELGSGGSSVVFAAYAKKMEINYQAFEQLPEWQAVVVEAIKPFVEQSAIRAVGTIKLDNIGGHYDQPIPSDADFIYVDAPTISSKPNDTYTGKAAYCDAPLFLRAGGRPKAIVVDARTDTVDLIVNELRAQNLSQDYAFFGGFKWAIQRFRYSVAAHFGQHSVFLHKDFA